MGLDQEQNIKEIKLMTDFVLCDPGQLVKLPGRKSTGVFVGRPLKASCSCLHGGVLTPRPVVLYFGEGEGGEQVVRLETFFHLPEPKTESEIGRRRTGLTVISMIDFIKEGDERYLSAKKLLEERQEQK